MINEPGPLHIFACNCDKESFVSSSIISCAFMPPNMAVYRSLLIVRKQEGGYCNNQEFRVGMWPPWSEQYIMIMAVDGVMVEGSHWYFDTYKSLLVFLIMFSLLSSFYSLSHIYPLLGCCILMTTGRQSLLVSPVKCLALSEGSHCSAMQRNANEGQQKAWVWNESFFLCSSLEQSSNILDLLLIAAWMLWLIDQGSSKTSLETQL